MTKITSGEVVAIAGTAARYMLAENIARRVEKDKPIGLAMGAFVTSDILDGMILREFDLDTPMRRITDGIVDHASQIRVAFEVVKKHPSARPYIGILAVRAAIVGGLNSLHLATTGEATRGGLIKNQQIWRQRYSE